MKKYTKENYFVNNKIPQDMLCELQARKDKLFEEVCEIEALLCEHKASVLKQRLILIKKNLQGTDVTN